MANADEVYRLGRQTIVGIQHANDLAAQYTLARVKIEAPKDHGRMAGSFTMKKTGDFSYSVEEGTNYGYYVWKGTGLYGERGRPIKPKRKKALRFEINGNVIIRKSVKGQKPNDFPERAADQAQKRVSDFVTLGLRKAGI
jgi:hypothetical protein